MDFYQFTLNNIWKNLPALCFPKYFEFFKVASISTINYNSFVYNSSPRKSPPPPTPVEWPTFYLTPTMLKSGVTFQPPPHHPPCSHGWLLKVLWVVLKKEPLCLSSQLVPWKWRELLRAQGHMTSHSNTCSLILPHLHTDTLSVPLGKHSHADWALAGHHRLHVVLPWPLARFLALPDCSIDAHTHADT